MKKIIATNLLCIITLFTSAQVYKAEKQLSPGTTNEHSLSFAKSLKGKFYYLDQKAIHKYDKGILFNYPRCPKISSFGLYDTVLVNDIEEFQGDLYVSSYYRFKVGADSFGVCFFDGTNWKPLSGTKNMRVLRICASGNFLYLEDIFNKLYKLDKLGNFTTIKTDNYYNKRLLPFNKTEIVWVDSIYIFKYNGSTFDSISSKYNGSIKYSISDGDSDVYVSSGKYLYKIDNSFSIQLLNSSWPINGDSTINRELIGKVDNYLLTRYFKGGWKFEVFDLSTKKFINLLTIANNFVYCSYNKVYTHNFDYSTGGRVKVYELTDGILVEGTLFEDLNKNCVKNKGENPKLQSMVTLSNGTETRLALANDTGYFKTSILPGNYTLKVEKKHTQTIYDSCGGNKTFSLGKTYKMDIPYRFDYPKKDIGISIISELGFLGRRGFSEKYALVYQNFGSTTENLMLTLEYPDSLKYVSSSANPKSHVGRQLTFEVNNVKKEESGKINLVFEIHAKKQLNSSILFIAYTDKITNDLDSSNNRDTLKLKTVAAIDPNIKESYPEGYVQHPVSKIRYHIQFQNEGNYYATRVVVVDTFDGKLPLTKIQMIGTKHPYTLRVENGNVLIWEFDNIQLMPKSMDEYGSRGYISFEAPLYKPLNIGESVKNRAHIYFDFEDPLPTPYAIVGVGKEPNTVKPIVSSKHSISVFPNPSKEQFNIQAEGQIGSIKVVDMMGRLILSQRIQNAEQILEAGHWSKGIYILHFEDKGISMKLVKE